MYNKLKVIVNPRGTGTLQTEKNTIDNKATRISKNGLVSKI